MYNFFGKFDFSIDNKGRVNIPSKFRNILNPTANNTFIICRGPDNCLRAYPLDVWENSYEYKIMSFPQTEEMMYLRRLIRGSLSDSTLDAQGRISLTEEQMRIAGITKGVTLVGETNHIEIWNTATHSAYLNNIESNYSQIFYQTVKKGIEQQ